MRSLFENARVQTTATAQQQLPWIAVHQQSSFCAAMVKYRCAPPVCYSSLVFVLILVMPVYPHACCSTNSREPDSAVKSSKSRGSSLRVHYQHMREISHQIKGMKLSKAKSYIEDVIDFKQIVPFTVYTGGVGRHAQAKQRSVRSIRKED